MIKSTCYLKMKTRLRGNKYWQLFCFLRNEIDAMEDKPWGKVCYFRPALRRGSRQPEPVANSQDRRMNSRQVTSYDEESAS
jgi:hypothetical protein